MQGSSGAFYTPDKSRTVHHQVADPPTRFIARQASGGLKTLYEQLSRPKQPHKHATGTQTDGEGRFCPCYPVPLLAARYKFSQVIGQGQSAVLIAAEDLFHPKKQLVAVKVMNRDYSILGAQEAECIQQLNTADPRQVSRTIRLLNKFLFDGHYCLVFELLHPRPLRLYLQRSPYDDQEEKFRIIRKITVQLLEVLGFLKSENVIHADMKPENILLEEGDEIKIKVIDFGNAIHCVHREVSLYYDQFELQTLLYRAPEVMFGVPFGPEVDMWSLGCILAELYTGEPLFLGRNKEEVMRQIFSLLGPFPRSPFQSGKFYSQFSSLVGQGEGNNASIDVKLMRRLNNCPSYLFANFIGGLLRYNPSQRLTPYQAALHPFLAREVPLAFLLAGQQHLMTDTGSSSCYMGLPGATSYSHKPNVGEGISRQHFSSIELLRNGTKGSSLFGDTRAPNSTPVGKAVSSAELLHKGTKGSPLFVGKVVSSAELIGGRTKRSPLFGDTRAPNSTRVGKVAPLRHVNKPAVQGVSGPALQEAKRTLHSNSAGRCSSVVSKLNSSMNGVARFPESAHPETRANTARQKRTLDSETSTADEHPDTGKCIGKRGSNERTKRAIRQLSSFASDSTDVWSIKTSTPKRKNPVKKVGRRKRSQFLYRPKRNRVEDSFSEEQLESCLDNLSPQSCTGNTPTAVSSERKCHGAGQEAQVPVLEPPDSPDSIVEDLGFLLSHSNVFFFLGCLALVIRSVVTRIIPGAEGRRISRNPNPDHKSKNRLSVSLLKSKSG